MRSVSVIGTGETAMGRFPERSLKSLIQEAGVKALVDSGVDKGDVDALYISNYNAQFLCGQGHLGPLASQTLGLGQVPAVRFEGACASGGLAFRQALISVASGMYDVVLVGGVEKMTHVSTETVTQALANASDVENEAEAGATFPSLFAMIANRYFHEYGNVRDEMALCAVQNHDNALKNPDAQLRKKISVEQVLNAVPIADPLTIFDCSLVSDGAAFVVLCATELVGKKSSGRPIEVIGSGHGGDVLALGSKRSLTTFDATVRAAKSAYDMAGIKPGEVDFAEVHDCFTITQIINGEDLGFFEKGKGGLAVARGWTSAGGKLPINLSGGLKAKGHPIGATGISQIHEVVTLLRGEAGERQLERAGIGLTQNLGGTAATCVVNIFRRR